ncbi:MAG: hypothetical protein ACHQ50_01400 [Fimbriimonadales bacterium]
MRLVTIVVLLAMGIASAQNYDTHGKTEADILKMGMDEWTSFFTSKEGSSTASMTEAAGIYGDIAQRRNDRLLKDRADKPKFVKLRKLMHTFASSAVDVSYCESGGGTMYNTMWAAVSGVVEDTLYSLISHTGLKAKTMVVSTVRKQLAKLQKEIDDMHRDDKNSEFFKYKDAVDALTSLNKSFDQIVAIAKTMSRAVSDRLLAFCLQEAKDTDLN